MEQGVSCRGVSHDTTLIEYPYSVEPTHPISSISPPTSSSTGVHHLEQERYPDFPPIWRRLRKKPRVIRTISWVTKEK